MWFAAYDGPMSAVRSPEQADGAVPDGAVPDGAVPERADPAGDAVGEDGLTDRQREVLAFERQWFRYAGAKEQAVRELFDLSATRYYQLLNALVDSPAAMAHDPMLVKRLRRVRAARRRSRSTRGAGGAG